MLPRKTTLKKLCSVPRPPCYNAGAMTPVGTIREIISHKGAAAWTISPDSTVFDAIQLMADKNIGALLVTKDGKLLGIVSERDYTRKVAIKGRSSKDTPVREILSGHVIHVTPEHSVEECMRLMTEHRVRHLPVLDGEKIAGVISIGDLVNWIISAQSSTIHQLETYITGYPTLPS
jgi:CBS domain-containing protein